MKELVMQYFRTGVDPVCYQYIRKVVTNGTVVQLFRQDGSGQERLIAIINLGPGDVIESIDQALYEKYVARRRLAEDDV